MNVCKFMNFVYAFCETYIFNLLYCTCMIYVKKGEKGKKENRQKRKMAVRDCEEAEQKTDYNLGIVFY